MSVVQYVPAHHRHRLLTESQVRAFITALDRARAAGDVEKAVEQAVNTLLTQGLSSIYGVPVMSTYAYNTDGYIPPSDPGNPYALLVEAKKNLNFSTSKHDVATVLAQVCWYLRAIGNAGDTVPSVTVVCDNDEIFAVPTTLLKHHVDGDYNWDGHSASTMCKDAALMAALINDSNIRPYVHDVGENFDAIMFIWAVDAMGCGQEPVKVPVSSSSIEQVFTRFKMEVLGTDASGLKNKDEIALFIDILRGNDDIYAHPKKPNTLVWGRRSVTLDTYRFERFWSQYVTGDYTLAQVKSLTEMGDVLIEETDRRFSGDYWTPPIWVDKSHEYIEAALGQDWKSRYVVWDSSAGSLNLTRDYVFSDLYCSTLFQEELDIATEYNPEATKFQYDFLNDDMVLHTDPDMTADKALALARAGKLKMPLPLVEALAENKPVVFYGNPPYGQATSHDGKKQKPGVAATSVTDLMEGMGHAKGELYTQFIWRTKELAKVFGYTADFHFFFFNKTFLTSPNFGKFVDELTSEFTFHDGFMMNAGEFNGTSSAWGVVFSHFEIGGTNQRTFDYSVLESNKDLSISKLTDWTGRSVRRGETISDWLANVVLPQGKNSDPVLTRNGLDSPTAKSIRCKPCIGSIGYLHNNGDNIQFSDKYIGMYSMGFAGANGRDITPGNLTRAAVTFSIRRAVQEVIARQGLLWVRDKDIFTRPSESLLTPEFVADCMVYSLFDRQSNQTSLRDYEYQGTSYRVVNEFFPFAHADVVGLAQEHTNRAVESDALGEGDRIMRRWLVDHDGDVSDQARAVLDMAWEIVVASFGKREVFDVVQPRFQVQSWDAGWAQVNAMVFGRDRVNDEVYDQFYVKWREARRALGDKIARAAMEDVI